MTQQESSARSMELPPVAPLRSEPPRTTSSTTGTPTRLSRVRRIALSSPEAQSVLDFDVETVAAGFADPDWVPQKITCVAWSWVGSDKVESRICGPEGIFGSPPRRAEMLAPLLEAISEAEMLTGHNILRFDLPVINAECMRLGLEPIREKRVQDTMKLARAKGFKKGQDNLETLFQTRQQKLALNWQEWQDAYDEEGWKTIRDRAETDVVGHKQIRQELIERRLLKPPVTWRA